MTFPGALTLLPLLYCALSIFLLNGFSSLLLLSFFSFSHDIFTLSSYFYESFFLSLSIYSMVMFLFPNSSLSTPFHSFAISVAIWTPSFYMPYVSVCFCVSCKRGKEKAIHRGDKKEQWYGREEMGRGTKR